MKNISVFHSGFSCLFLAAFLLVSLTLVFASPQSFAQDNDAAASQQNSPVRLFQGQMRAASSSVLMTGDVAVNLWGVEPVSEASPVFKIKARTALDNAIGGKDVTCEIKSRNAKGLLAQCSDHEDLDLSLFMLQKGYVTVDRTAVFGTVFENVYVQAEMEAQNRGLGIWGMSSENGASGGSSGLLFINLTFVLFLCILGAFATLSVIVMRGFKKIVEAQGQHIEMMNKERLLRDKERSIIATMIDAELKSNKSKIEAYLVVYEEMLAALKDENKSPRYQKSGDIIQAQPMLSRVVFDRNSDKLHMLGRDLSGDLTHFYADITSDTEYKNLDPEMDLKDAILLVEESVYNARRINELAERLIEVFEETGVMREHRRGFED